MRLTFTYDKEKDIWCLLNKGKSSNNSQSPTKVYEQLVAAAGENPTPEQTSEFIDKYLAENNIDLDARIRELENSWAKLADEYQTRAEQIFGTTLSADITVYLTINNRCPYDITNDSFFVSLSNESPTRTIMHELWHFYTWYELGAGELEKLGNEKYNDLKESLTVLLNIECKDLLPEGVEDTGYPQHAELRKRIVELWSQEKDIRKVWETASNDGPR